MDSDNPTSAENQQERPGVEQWIVGFVDGEGCFSIGVVRNVGCRLGWQAQHEFSVTQAVRSRDALELIRTKFGCGTIIENRRSDNHRMDLARFSVKRRQDLIEVVVPFFRRYPLVTAKARDFDLFCEALSIMEQGQHLSETGLRSIAQITEQMNRKGRSRFLESSEAKRRPPWVQNPRAK
jgi:hypothetical protein